MRTKSFNWEVVALLVLILIPWPGPTIFKISCPRDSATVVRKVVQKKWIPILEKRSVKLGVECPFHPSRDIFGTQQAAKQQHRASQWTCALCGKSFYTERHLDAHFDSRHRDTINVAEDAVCLADYCDVMRCEVVAGRDEEVGRATDMEVWRHAQGHGSGLRTALSVSPPRDLARVSKGAAIPSLKAPFGGARQKHQQQSPRCSPPSSTSRPSPTSGTGSSAPSRGTSPGSASRDGDGNATADVCAKADLVDSSLPPHQAKAQARLAEMQRLKADCKPEELQKLKTRCEILVRDCIAGLLVNLSIQDFKEIEDELNRVSCWYLTCDRYWEDSPSEARPFPWFLVGIMGGMLAGGVVICYYIIWVLFDTPSTDEACDSLNPRPPRHPRGSPRAGTLPGGAPYQYNEGQFDSSVHVKRQRQQERNLNPSACVPVNGRPISAPPSTAGFGGPPPPQPQQQQFLHHPALYHRQAMAAQHAPHYQHQLYQQQQYQQRQDQYEREWKI